MPSSNKPDSRPVGSGVKILIAEDDAIIAASLENTLAGLGYSILPPVSSGSQAVEIACKEKPDIVLMDIQLIGDMTGIDAAETIHTKTDIPVIYLTAHSNEAYLKQVEKDSTYGFLIKPVQIQDLTTAIRMALYKHQLDRHLRESENRYRTLVETHTDIIMRFDRAHRHLFVNSAVSAILPLKPADFIGKTHREMGFPENLCDLWEKSIDEVFTTKKPYLTEFSFAGLHGETFIDWKLIPEFSDDGGVATILTIARDMTHRKEMEAELRKSEAKYRTLVEQSTEAIFTVDKNGRFRFVNTIFASMLGEPPEYFIGKSCRDLLPKEDADQCYEAIIKVFKTGNTETLEVRYPVADKTLWYLGTLNPVRDAEGNIGGILGHLKDITERKMAEEALKKVNHKLNLLAEITRHDVRNKITALLGYIAAMKIRFEDPSQLEYISKLERVAKSMRAQIEFMKNYQKLGTHEPQWQNLGLLLPGSAIQQGIQLSVDLPDVEIFADPMAEKVFDNLLDNAIRHGGNVTKIRVSCHQEPGGLTIIWEDNGVGIPAHEKDWIFERGYGKNTGLGMFLAKEILGMTGITIQETGEPGKGARFEMIVPMGSYRQRG
jgi:PAS domain S-box-containing protein